MKNLLVKVCLLLLIPVVNTYGEQESKKLDPCIDPLTVEEVNTIAERIPGLKQGMSRDEVYEGLGADLLKKVCLMSGGGPSSSYRQIHYLRRGYNLVLVFDSRKFKRAVMTGDEWERERRKRSQRQHNKSLERTAN